MSRCRAPRLLIVGCGDVGLRFLRQQQALIQTGRLRVFVLTSSAQRIPALRALGATPILGNLDHAASLRRLAALADRVLMLAPPRATEIPQGSAAFNHYKNMSCSGRFDGEKPQKQPEKTLNDGQAAALQAIAVAQSQTDSKPLLLFGRTGSGKTEVYMQAAAQALAATPTAQVLVLVPEINLTPQLLAQFSARFAHLGAGAVLSMHSGMTLAERSSAWLAAHSGSARIDYQRSLATPFVDLSLGQHNYRRLLTAGSTEINGLNLLAGVELAPSREIHVLQIIREALSNIERHAHARHVSVTLKNSENNLLMVSVEVIMGMGKWADRRS